MKQLSSLLIIFLVIGCNAKKSIPISSNYETRSITKVNIETIIRDSLMNVRALELIEIEPNKEVCIFLTSNGEFGSIFPMYYDAVSDESTYVKHVVELSNDSLKLNFRSLAVTKDKGFGITIGNPALLFNLDADLEKNKIVYKEEGEGVFYDSMDFWNDQEGIAIGDSIDGCLSIIITRDSGTAWTKLTCDELPEATENEGAFAASDTNIAIVGDKTWVATTAGRIYYSEDKGKTWEVNETPIVKEKDTEGIYSIDFYDELNGFAIGGDYTKAADSTANKIRTQDGGKTWQLVAENQSPGYRSCVQYIPNSVGKELVAIGFKGIDYSNDSGNSWRHLSDEGFYTIRFLNDSIAYAAGNKRISKLTFKE